VVSGLRERRHAETRQAIADAAFALFHRHGFSDTVMEHIAEHAGVSRSTLYRRYRSKEDIVLEVPRAWLGAWDRAIDELADEATLAEAMAVGCRAVAAEIDASADRVLLAYAALSESPTLQSSGVASRDWLERIAALVHEKKPELDRFDALTIAGAHLGAIDTMMLAWAASGGDHSVVEATDRVLERLAALVS